MSNTIAIPARVGRFTVEGHLGSGAQGVVVAARDVELDRRVAIKLLKSDYGAAAGAPISNEARIAGQLQHPNIVAVFEVGMHDTTPYIVFEYIDGQSLRELIEAEPGANHARSVILMSQVLSGVAHLHKHQVVHRDLNPSNIMITREGVPKVTDFGLAEVFRPGAEIDQSMIAGTLRYMPPEILDGGPPSYRSDIFSLAAIFFEMLSGTKMIPGHTAPTVINTIQTYSGAPDLAIASPFSDALNQIIQIAGAADPDARFTNAALMKQRLDRIRVSHDHAPAAPDRSYETVGFLLRRMRHAKAFSAMSGHVSELLNLTSEDSDAAADRIANVLQKDLTLTQRVLTTANSAFINSGHVSTVPRAIMLLGLENIRACIANVLLNTQFDANNPHMQDALLVTFHAAIMAKELARKARAKRLADIYTAALFHDLGRLLTLHYFADEHAAIQRAAAERDTDELTASRDILGIAYHQLGAAVGAEWKLPELLTKAMSPLPRGELHLAGNDDMQVHHFAAFGHAVSRCLLLPDDNAVTIELADLLNRVELALPFDGDLIEEVSGTAAELSLKYARLIKRAPRKPDPCVRLLVPFAFGAAPARAAVAVG